MDSFSVPGRSILQSSCYSESCRKKFTNEARGMTCSRCRMAVYCSPVCQKNAFASHKELCKRQQAAQRLARSGDIPLHERRPNIEQDMIHILPNIVRTSTVTARSGLRLGHPDSLADTHWQMVTFEYIVPTPERWSLTSDKPFGDEHKLFRFSRLEVLPDEDLFQHMGALIDESHKEFRSKKHKSGCKCGCAAYSRVLLVIHIKSVGGPEEWSKKVCTYGVSEHVPDIGPPYSIRNFVPFPSLLYALRPFPVPKDEKENNDQHTELDNIDYALSEDAKRLETLPFKPKGGLSWADYQDKLDKETADLPVSALPSDFLEFLNSLEISDSEDSDDAPGSEDSDESSEWEDTDEVSGSESVD